MKKSIFIQITPKEPKLYRLFSILSEEKGKKAGYIKYALLCYLHDTKCNLGKVNPNLNINNEIINTSFAISEYDQELYDYLFLGNGKSKKLSTFVKQVLYASIDESDEEEWLVEITKEDLIREMSISLGGSTAAVENNIYEQKETVVNKKSQTTEMVQALKKEHETVLSNTERSSEVKAEEEENKSTSDDYSLLFEDDGYDDVSFSSFIADQR